MKHYSISNIHIDYDMEKHNIKVRVYWHSGWWQPVVYIPPFCDYIDVLYELGEDLGLYRYE